VTDDGALPALPAKLAPVLVIAIGNPSRGDDALGPTLATRLESLAVPGVEVLTDFQLQVEHALDLRGRERVVFVDCSVSARAPFELARVHAAPDATHTSHALSPAAVLDAYRRVTGGEPPPSWVLAIRGERFELGEPIGEVASSNLDAALAGLWAFLLAPER
jgi:hydrogenase maturation protease